MSAARPRNACSSGLQGVFVLAAVALLGAGCASRGSTELLEANLRQHQDRLTESERQVSNLRNELASARAEADQLRRELVALGKDGRQETTEPLARVAGIQFNSMMTGGRDSDGAPGHDVITAVLAPHDQDGDLVKLGGHLEVEVLDLTQTGEQRRVGLWKYTAEQARSLWHSGFLASGYQLDLPVEKMTKDSEVILHGRLTTADGRQFDTTCPVSLVSAPRALAPPASARPLTRSKLSSDPDAASEMPPVVVTASAEVVAEPRKRPVEQAGFALLSADDTPTQSRPVPPPMELPVEDDLPVVRPGASPRPFPTGETKVEQPASRTMPSGIMTSDRWTDETIPSLR